MNLTSIDEDILDSVTLPTTESRSILGFIESLGDSDDDSGDGNGFYSSLDMDIADEEESHYLGSGAFSYLSLDRSNAESSLAPIQGGSSETRGTFSYRQVAHPDKPVYFLRNPSKVYGSANVAFEAGNAYKAATDILMLTGNISIPDVMQKFLTGHLPAVPIINRVRLEGACNAWGGGGPFPYSLLVGIIAYTAVSIPCLAGSCKELWSIVLHLLDNEYRKPRLQTIQLALLDIYGRPTWNVGGNHVAIARAVGVAQLLGLHCDCSQWRLPRWEKSIRKRLWWALVVADKWNALVGGRPSNVHLAGHTVPPPTLLDDDWRGSLPERAEIGCFVAMCRLTIILDRLLPSSRGPLSDLEIWRLAAAELETVYQGLPVDTQPHIPMSFVKPPGACALRLCHLAISLLIYEGMLALDLVHPRQYDRTIDRACVIVEDLTAFLASLEPSDYSGFWTPWSSHVLSQAPAILLRLYLRAPPNLRSNRAVAKTIPTVETLLRTIKSGCDASWEVALSSAARIKLLIASCPHLPALDCVKSILGSDVSQHDAEIDIEAWLDSFQWMDPTHVDRTTALIP